MSPPISNFCSSQSFHDAGLQWIENTPGELEAATIEMLHRTDPDLGSLIPDNDRQKKFKTLAENCGSKYGDNSVKAFASISKDFLDRHADLL